MKASMFYRIAAVVLLLFAVGHTLGFRQSDPITVVSCRYLFVIPIVFSILITSCLTAAAWLSARQASKDPQDQK